MPKKTSRFRSGLKTQDETTAYRRGVDSFDKTETDPIDSNKTNESSFEEEEPLAVPSVKTLSLWTRFLDLLRNHPIASVLVGVAATAIIGYFTFLSSLNRDVGVQTERVDELKKTQEKDEQLMERLRNDIESIKENNAKLSQDLAVFKAETLRDVEHLKERGAVK